MIYRNYNFTETVKKALNIAERITVKAENSKENNRLSKEKIWRDK